MNTHVAARRFSLAAVVVALAALLMVTVGASQADAAGYKWMGKHDNINYYMCKSSSTAIKVRGTASTTVSGYSFRIEGKTGGFAYYSLGTTAALTKGKSSYVTVTYRSSDSTIYVRTSEWLGNQGGVGSAKGYSISAIPAC